MQNLFTRVLRTTLALLITGGLSGCYSLTLQSASDTEIMLSGPETLDMSHYRMVRHFYHTRELHYVFGIPLAEENERLLSQVLDSELSPGQQVINLQARRYVTPLAQLNTLLTLGLYLRVQMIIEGDILEKR